MTLVRQWLVTCAICATAAACAMFHGPTVKDGKICEVVDFGSASFEVCAGTAAELDLVKQSAAARRAQLAK